MLPELWKNRESMLRPFSDDFLDRFFYGWPSLERKTEGNWSPRVDIHETEKAILLDVELPGLEKKDIKVDVKDNVLTISGERKEEKKFEKADCCRTERYYGKFYRSFTLPDIVDHGAVSAEYKNGVLSLELKKTEKALPKEINIEVK